MGRPPQLVTDLSLGFVDLKLGLSELVRQEGGGWRVRASAMHEGRPVGFAALLPALWEHQRRDGQPDLYWGTVTLVSTGGESAQLLSLLGQLYGQPRTSGAMVGSVMFTAVGLASDPTKVETEPVHLKLFYEPAKGETADEDYAEVFLDIDTGAGTVELNEKDLDYRLPLLRALSEPML